MTNKKRHAVIPAVFLMVKKDNDVLLQRRYNTGFQDGQYTLPSGHVEKNETPSKAATREAYEEAGIQVETENITLEQVIYRRGYNTEGYGFDKEAPERVDFFFSTEQWIGEPRITEPDKCDDLSWFPLHDLPTNTFPIVKEFLEEYPDQSKYKEAGYAIPQY